MKEFTIGSRVAKLRYDTGLNKTMIEIHDLNRRGDSLVTCDTVSNELATVLTELSGMVDFLGVNNRSLKQDSVVLENLRASLKAVIQ